MERLSCSAKDCVNNINFLCSAKAIHVKGIDAYSSSGTLCSTYKFNNFTNAVSSVPNVNFYGAITQPFTHKITMSPEIACDAIKCVHNSKGYCAASDVLINGEYADSMNKVICETFKPL